MSVGDGFVEIPIILGHGILELGGQSILRRLYLPDILTGTQIRLGRPREWRSLELRV